MANTGEKGRYHIVALGHPSANVYTPEYAMGLERWAPVGSLKEGDVVRTYGLQVFTDDEPQVVHADPNGDIYMVDNDDRKWWFTGQIEGGVYLGIEKVPLVKH